MERVTRLSDFFYHHYVLTVRCETEYFHLTARLTCKFFGCKLFFANDLKTQPLMITKNWATPKMSCISIALSIEPEPSIPNYEYLFDIDCDMIL